MAIVELEPLGEGFPTRDQMAIHLAVLAALARDRESFVANMLGTQGIVGWAYRPTSWPPSYFVFRSGNKWTVFLNGTSNFPQILMHVNGSFWLYEKNGPYVWNGAWYYEAMRVFNEINERINIQNPETLDTIGHSYGGAVAVILGHMFSFRYPNVKVRTCTYGAPKERGENGETPNNSVVRVNSTNDAVPELPIDGLNISTLAEIVLPEFGLINSGYNWTHTGPEIVINNIGLFASRNTNVENPPNVSTNTGTFAPHLYLNYLARLLAWARDEGNPQPQTEVLELGVELCLTVRPPAPVPYLPRFVETPFGTLQIPLWDLDEINSNVRFTSQERANVPTELRYISNPNPYTMTAFFHAGVQGWSESYTFNFEGVGDINAALVAIGSDYKIYRRAFLNSAWSLQGVRWSSDLIRADAAYPLFGANVGPGEALGTPDDPDKGCIGVFAAGGGTVTSSITYRGWSLNALPTPNGQLQGGGTASETLNNFFSASKWGKRWKVSGYTASGQPTAYPAIATYDRRISNSPFFQIIGWSVSSAGLLQVTIDGVVIDFAPGDRILLANRRSECVRGISGEYSVIEVSPQSGGTQLTLNRRPPCNVGALAGVVGTIRKYIPVWVYVDDRFNSRLSTRKTGRNFFARRGRAKNRRC